MKLSGIEIRGFKSFSDPTRIRFKDNRVVAIVGPNGCGKSNVVDALRWVLGEQSAKHLRGQDMKDVIFSGSKNRSQSGMASVTLSFDNFQLPDTGLFKFGDFSEISVGRRLYRDGTSEYTINNTPARLKDVRDIFLDTGVSGKGYSIIEQGMIGRIITARPEERLHIVEEAAGILKFKIKKQEANRKLESSRHNLLRINDLLGELRERETSLHGQVERAEKFMAAKSISERLTNQCMAFRWHTLNEKNESVAERIEIEKNAERDNQTALHILHTRLETLRVELIGDEDALEGFRRETETLKLSISSKENELKIKDEQVKNLRAWKSRETTDMSELETAIKNYDTHIVSATHALETSRAMRERTEEEIRIATGRRDTLKTRHDEQKKSIDDTGRRFADLKGQLSTATMYLSQTEKRLAEYRVELRESETDGGISSVEGVSPYDTVSSIDEQSGALQKKIDEHHDILEAIERDHENARTEKNRAIEEKTLLERKLAPMEAERLKLHTITETYIFNSDASKRLAGYFNEHKQRANEVGFIGAMSSLFALKPGTPTEIAVAWDRFSDVFVFSSHRQSGIIATILKDLSANHAALCFLDLMPPPSSQSLHAQYTRFSDYLNPFYTTEPVVFPDYVFCVPKNFDDLPESVLNRPVYWFDGNFFTRDPAGIIYFTDSNAGLFGRQNEKNRLKLTTMSDDIDAIKQNLSAIDTDLARRVALIEELEQMKTGNETKKRELEFTLSETHIRFSAEEKQRRTLESIKAAKIKKQADLNEKISSRQNDIQSMRGKIAEVKTELEGIGESLSQKEPALQKTASELNDADEHRQELRLRNQELGNTHQNSQDALNRNRRHRDEAVARLEGFQSDYKNKASTEELTHQEIEAIKTQIPILLNAFRQSEKYVVDKKNAVETKKQAVLEIEEEKTAQSNKIRTSEKLKHAAGLKQAEIEKELLMMEENLRDVSGLHPKEVLKQIDVDTFDETAAKKEIGEKRAIIADIGNVNMESFDEYKSLKERLVFLEEQHADLTESIEALKQSIAALESDTDKKFLDTLNQINQNLHTVFPMLFGGGTAKLIFTGAEEGGKQGIDIAVNIPGKKLRTMNLLSGGEKAMSALAIVFSIFLIKPSPFCVLDEVDAPLDDANVKRFCNALKVFSEKTRFIVITHNKVTMASADFLIGVTMGEPGVSKIVSVRVSDYVSSPTGSTRPIVTGVDSMA